MKKTLLLLFLVFSFTISAQEVERSIIIKDADTNTPREDVSVFITNTKQLLLSNSEGKVTFDGTELKPAALQAESTATEVAELVTDFNALLLKLKTAGLMESE